MKTKFKQTPNEKNINLEKILDERLLRKKKFFTIDSNNQRKKMYLPPNDYITDNKTVNIPPNDFTADNKSVKRKSKDIYPLINKTFKKSIMLKFLKIVPLNRTNSYKDFLYGMLFNKSIFHFNHYYIAVYNYYKNMAINNIKLSHNITGRDILMIFPVNLITKKRK